MNSKEIEEVEKILLKIEAGLPYVTTGDWKSFDNRVMAEGSTDTYSGSVLGTIIRCEATSVLQDFEGRVWSTNGSPSNNAKHVANCSHKNMKLILKYISKLKKDAGASLADG